MDRPAKRTALISQELPRYSINLVSLAETRLPDEGNPTEDLGGRDIPHTSDDFMVWVSPSGTFLREQIKEAPVGISQPAQEDESFSY